MRALNGGSTPGGGCGPWWWVRAGGVEVTLAVAEALGRRLEPGDVVTLDGPLGSGKTTFVKGLARGLGLAPESVVSPTFLYVREVPGGRLPLFHVDAYRLLPPGAGTGEGPAGEGTAAGSDAPQGARAPVNARALMDELGLSYYLQAGGVVAVEWPEPLGHLLPSVRIEVRLEMGGPGPGGEPERVVRLRGCGKRPQEVLRQLAGELGWAGEA